MPKKTENSQPEVFEQRTDERGRIVLDRPFSAAEAAAIDEANRQAAEHERAKRFEGRD